MVFNISAKQAWGVIAAGVLAYELACNEGELLSEGVDDWVATKPILARSGPTESTLPISGPPDSCRAARPVRTSIPTTVTGALHRRWGERASGRARRGRDRYHARALPRG